MVIAENQYCPQKQKEKFTNWTEHEDMFSINFTTSCKKENNILFKWMRKIKTAIIQYIGAIS